MDDIVALLKSNLTNTEIGQRLGKHHVTVSRLRTRLGIPAKKGSPKVLQPRQCDECEKWYDPVNSKSRFCSMKCRGKYHAAVAVPKMLAAENPKDHQRAELGWSSWRINPDTPEYRRYANKVHRLTRHVYEANAHIINPHNHPRTLAGVPGGYHLDHKVSVRYGFDNGWPPEQLATVDNLQMLPWRDNVRKGSKVNDQVSQHSMEEPTGDGQRLE